MTEVPHPRAQYQLMGAEAAERSLADALARGRLHHAWLLCGPEGIGKATFAYRATRWLLGARPDPGHGLLGASPADPVSRLVETGAHPDLLVLERAMEGGRLRKSISVEDMRALPEFFAKSPSMGGYRIAIVDAADDLNANSANALLKTLEEPPQHAVLFLVAHRPARLLPTIRSRCRRLSFRPWDEAAVSRFLMDLTDADDDEAAQLAAMAQGSPGLALALKAADAGALEQLARHAVVSGLPPEVRQRLTDSFRGGEGADRFDLFIQRLAANVRATALTAPGRQADRLAEVWSALAGLPDEVAALNLDRTDAVLAALDRVDGARTAHADR